MSATAVVVLLAGCGGGETTSDAVTKALDDEADDPDDEGDGDGAAAEDGSSDETEDTGSDAGDDQDGDASASDGGDGTDGSSGSDGSGGSDGSSGGDGSSGSTDDASPPTTRPAADTLAFTAEGSVLGVASSNPDRDHQVDSCPIEPTTEQRIVACEFAAGAGGEVLATVEEYAGDFAVTVWERSGVPGSGPWRSVWGLTYGESQPDKGIEAVTLDSSAFRDLADVVILDVDLGGSGGMRSLEVIGWPAGASGAQILAVTDPRPAASLRPVAGRLLLTANHLADDDPTCCPSEREVVVFDHPSGTPVDANRTYIPRDETVPVEIALRVYAAWRDQDVGSVSDLLVTQAEAELASVTGPGEDTYELHGRGCEPTSAGYACTFADTGGSADTFVLDVHRVGDAWLVGDVVFG